MYKNQLKIELLSDLCVADGNGYNSSVDIEVCQDVYGLPYIPAKRLKGCLRERARELNDWGDAIPIKSLFGDEGYRRGVCSIRNAYLDNRDEYLSEISEGGDYALCHPQNILGNFTYIRNQTSIHYESGAALDKSLRTMRVIKKGLVFVADVEWDDKEAMERNSAYLQSCCAVLKHMGVSRTRGFGNVRVSVEERNQTDRKGSIHYVEGAARLTYEIILKESIICKAVNGQEQNSLDYIEGAKILGIIADRINRSGQDFVEFMGEGGGNLKCSNAYLKKEGVRLVEVPASLYEIKNNATDYCDKIYESSQHGSDDKENKQLNPIKHSYVAVDEDGGLKKYNVAMEERYHHRRPEDKSIGRATESEDSVFYQISSICAGQTFQGFITGNERQIKQIYDMFAAESEIQIGYGKTSEYGRCEIRAISMEVEQAEKSNFKEFWIHLVSPAILYNNRAFYTTDVTDLKAELAAALGIEMNDIDDKEIRYFVNLTTIGGYNVTWQMKKPTIEAFDKGTVVHIKLNKEIEIPSRTTWIGERNAEGYGEIAIHPVHENGLYLHEGKVKKSEKKTEQNPLKLGDKPHLTEIAGNLFRSYLEYQAACDVDKESDKELLSDRVKPTVQNMILICESAKTIEDVREAVSSRYDKTSAHKQEKGEVANEILRKVHDRSETLEEEFQTQQNLEQFVYKGDTEMEYLRQYLIQIRYKLHRNSTVGTSIQEGENV